MADDPSGIIDGIRNAYTKVKNAINSVPTPGYSPQKSDHDKAIEDMTKQADAKRTADATRSFTVKNSATTPSVVQKPVVKPAPKKAMGKSY